MIVLYLFDYRESANSNDVNPCKNDTENFGAISTENFPSSSNKEVDDHFEVCQTAKGNDLDADDTKEVESFTDHFELCQPAKTNEVDDTDNVVEARVFANHLELCQPSENKVDDDEDIKNIEGGDGSSPDNYAVENLETSPCIE